MRVRLGNATRGNRELVVYFRGRTSSRLISERKRVKNNTKIICSKTFRVFDFGSKLFLGSNGFEECGRNTRSMRRLRVVEADEASSSMR